MNISREVMDVVFAKHGSSGDTPRRSGISGEHAKTSPSGKNQIMSSISTRIEGAQTRINGLRDQLSAHLESLNDESPDDASTALTEDLTSKLESQEKSLDALRNAEVRLAKAAGTTSRLPAVVSPPHEERAVQELIPVRNRPFAVAAKKVRPMDYLFKALAVDIKHYGEGRKRPILEVLKEHYGDNDMGEAVRTVMGRLVTKAATIPADTTTSGWADSLVQTVIGDFIDSLLPYSVYPALSAKGGSFTFGRNGTISLPARNTATNVAGAFVAQGAPIPVKQGAFTAITLTPKKMGVITTMTREITEHSTPAIEAILRQAIQEDTAVAIDTVLLDANAATTTRPAGLKNGQAKVAASVTASIVGFIADLKGLIAALITATGGNIRNPVWIMNPGDVLAASLLQTTTGDTPFREELAGGTLLGYPIISTTTGLNDMMALIDAADFITATGDTPQFSVSDQAVLHMEDTTPAQISTVATPNAVAAPVRSLWQTDSMAIRMIMDINWAKRRTGIFQWTDTMAWN
jgi:HK97 family phage major capsid protein